MQGAYNTTKDVFNTWSESNPNAKYPLPLRFVDQVELQLLSYPTLFASKGNHLGLENCLLSYTFPQELSKRLYMQKPHSYYRTEFGLFNFYKDGKPEISSGISLATYRHIFGVLTLHFNNSK